MLDCAPDDINNVAGDMEARCSINGSSNINCGNAAGSRADNKPKIERLCNVANEMSLDFMNNVRDKAFADKTAFDPANSSNTLTLLGPGAKSIVVVPHATAAVTVGGLQHSYFYLAQ